MKLILTILSLLIIPLFLIGCENSLAGKAIHISGINSVGEAIEAIASQDEEIVIILTDSAPASDNLAAADIAMFFQEVLGKKEITVKLVQEISSLNRPAILIGGPCANKFTEEAMDITCITWPYQQGEGIISYYEVKGNPVIVVAGTLGGDTRAMSKEFQKYKTSSKLQSSTTALFGKPEVRECGNNICDTGETDQNCALDCSQEKSVRLTSAEDSFSPKIAGSNIVWWSYDQEKYFLYRGKTGEVIKLNSNSVAGIDGDYVVSLNPFNLYHILTGEIVSIPGESTYQDRVAISGNNVVFSQPDENCELLGVHCAVYLYDINTKQKKKLFLGTEPEGLSLYGNWVVYGDRVKVDDPLREFSKDIFAYNTLTGEYKQLSTDPEVQNQPKIYGDIVVWEDRRHGDKEIYAYDLTKNKEWRVTSSISDQTWPKIDGNIITWLDNRNGNSDIYYCDLTKNGLLGGCLENDKKIRVTYKAVSQGPPDVSNGVLTWPEEVGAEEVKPSEGDYAGAIGAIISKNDIFIFSIPNGGLPQGFVMPKS